MPLSAADRWASWGLAAAFVIVQAVDVSTYPLFQYDEPLLNDAGWQLVTAGHFRADVLRLLPGFEDHYLWQPPGLALSAALSYGLFGVGIIQTRLPSILYGGLAIWAMVRLVRAADPNAGCLGGVLAALSLFFWPDWSITSKLSRMDTAAIAACLIGTIFAFNMLRDGGVDRRALFAGLACGVGMAFHTAAFPWAAVLGLVLLVYARRHAVAAVLFAAGAGLMIGMWLLYCLLHLDAFVLQYLTLLGDRVPPQSIFHLDGLIPWRNFRDLAKVPLAIPVAFIGLAGIGFQLRNRDLQPLLTLTAVSWLLYALATRDSRSGFYSLYPLSLFFCVIGIGLHELSVQFKRRRWPAAVAAGAHVAFLLNAAGQSIPSRVLAGIYQRDQRNYETVLASLKGLLKPGDRVWGSAVVWLAVVRAGAKLDVSNWIPGPKAARPDPDVHKFVVVDEGTPFDRMEDYDKIISIGAEMPLVLGRRLTDKPYLFDVWKSQRFRHDASVPRRN